MRRIVVVAICLLFPFSIFLSAQEKSSAGSASKWSGSFSSAVGNRYVGTTVCAVFADQTVIQSELDLTRAVRSTTLTTTVWNSTGITPSTAFDTYAYETDVDINVAHRF